MELAEFYSKTDRQRSFLIKNWRERKKFLRYIKALRQLPCAVCGLQYPPHLMEIDHTEPQELKLGESYRKHGWSGLTKNMWDTVVLCALCHKDITYKRTLKVG